MKRNTTFLILIAIIMLCFTAWWVLTNKEDKIVIQAPAYEITADEFQYMCFTIPVLEAGEHAYITQITPFAGNDPHATELIHAYYLYTAEGNADITQPGTHACERILRNPIFVAQPNTDTFNVPEEVGIPLGGKEETKLILQVQYENPTGITGLVDTAGFTLHLDKHNELATDMLILGSVFDIIIPPNETVDFVSLRCSADDTMAIGPFKVWTSSFHGHALIDSIWLSHYRNGVLLQEVGRGVPFDHEQLKYAPEQFDVLPGDELEVHCRYTNPTNETVTGGYTSNKETCLAYLMYYPASEYSYCGGQIVNPIPGLR